jgi:hypothetical protein
VGWCVACSSNASRSMRQIISPGSGRVNYKRQYSENRRPVADVPVLCYVITLSRHAQLVDSMEISELLSGYAVCCGHDNGKTIKHHRDKEQP